MGTSPPRNRLVLADKPSCSEWNCKHGHQYFADRTTRRGKYDEYRSIHQSTFARPYRTPSSPVNCSTFLHDQSMQTYISGRQPCTQRHQPIRDEIAVLNRLWQRSIFQRPARHFRQITREPALDRGTVLFAQNTAPVPLANFVTHGIVLPPIAEFGQDCRQRYQLRPVRQIAPTKYFLAPEKLTCASKSFFDRTGMCEIVLGQIAPDFLAGDATLTDGSSDSLVQQAKSLGVKIIMMTGNPERIVEFDAARQPYLSKPFPPGALVEKIEEVLAAPSPPNVGTG